jgi:ADP-ribose pyrophosphatase
MDKPHVPHQIRKAFAGRIFTVHVESITLPRGERLEAEIIRHPGSVVLIPVTESGDIILVRQFRPAVGAWAWELPAGSLKRDEDPQAAALRECQEEIGLIPATLDYLGMYYPTPGYCDEQMNFYRATGLREPGEHDPAAQRDEDEDIEPKAFSVKAIREMIATGELVDLKTVAGLTLLEGNGHKATDRR